MKAIRRNINLPSDYLDTNVLRVNMDGIIYNVAKYEVKFAANKLRKTLVMVGIVNSQAIDNSARLLYRRAARFTHVSSDFASFAQVRPGLSVEIVLLGQFTISRKLTVRFCDS